MRSEPAIAVHNLGKQYRINALQPRYRTLRDTLTDACVRPVRRLRSLGGRIRDNNQEMTWVLRGVSCQVNPGEVVAIIGRNGAGKSTLLKVLSRITDPTEGYAEITGQIGSLLDVGTGFHPELTGRENIYLNGSILGMRRAEIDRSFDEIVAFAEVERFLDTQVKHYSSGMQMRLAFAVAAHLTPEIIVIDEVLAVGDAAFQRKCIGKMSDVAKQGRTVLFVSHNMTAVQTLCNRAIWLANGRVVADGEAGDIVARYLQDATGSIHECVWTDPESAPGNDKVRLNAVKVSARMGHHAANINVATPIDIEFRYWNFMPGASLNLSFFLYNIEEVCVFNAVSECRPRPAGLISQTCHIPADLLNDGTYYLKMLVVADTSVVVFASNNVGGFEVHDVERNGAWFGKWPGAVRPSFKWDWDAEDAVETCVFAAGSAAAHHGQAHLRDI